MRALQLANECTRCDQSQLTDDHEGEKVSIEEVQQDWLVPCFHADHSSDQVNEGDGLEGDETQGIRSLEGWKVKVVTVHNPTPPHPESPFSCNIQSETYKQT